MSGARRRGRAEGAKRTIGINKRPEELLPFLPDQVDALADELGPVYGPLAIFAAETGLRTNEWVALERRNVDRAGRAVTVQRRFADGELTPYPKTQRSVAGCR